MSTTFIAFVYFLLKLGDLAVFYEFLNRQKLYNTNHLHVFQNIFFAAYSNKKNCL